MGDVLSIGSVMCRRVSESMVAVLGGTASDFIFEHIARCKRCQRRRQDAERARELVLDTSSDYRHPRDLVPQILESLTPCSDSDEPSPGQLSRRAPKVVVWVLDGDLGYTDRDAAGDGGHDRDLSCGAAATVSTQASHRTRRASSNGLHSGSTDSTGSGALDS